MKKIILLIIFVIISLFSRSHIYAEEKNCATILELKTDVTEVTAKTPFKCIVKVDEKSAGSKTIGCGISFNGEHPANFCPSDTYFGGWQGNEARFNCVFPNTNLPQNVKTVELTAFDFSKECGVQTGKKISLKYKVDTSSSAQNPSEQVQQVNEMLRQYFASQKLTPSPVPSGSQGTGQGDVVVEPTYSLPTPLPLPTTVSPSILPSYTYSDQLVGYSQNCLRYKSTYEQASQSTGVPWQVLAGIHYREGSCATETSLVSGRAIHTIEPDVGKNCSSLYTGPGRPVPIGNGCGFNSVLDSAIYAGNHLKSKIGTTPKTYQQLVTSLSRYNGGGNSNCGSTGYKNCPAFFEGEDDTYVLNYFDNRHSQMFIVYCADYTLCRDLYPYPVPDKRPGVLTVTNIVSSL